MELEGRVAWVTGAAGGIGRAVIRRLAEDGARIAATDTDAATLIDAVADLPGYERHLALALDVRDAAAVEAAADRIEAELGPITVAVNGAGILRTGPIAELTQETWEEVLRINATGVFLVSRAAARRMAARGRGSIVTVASNAAALPRIGMAAYAASKAASTIFTKCLGLELAASGVRCNVVAPGSVETAMQYALWHGPDARQKVIDGDPSTYRLGIPLGRLADPEDVAETVAFLAGERSRHITMQDIYVDGGQSLRA
ncbi:2,3-dihydro-2,3-dihydroxybenzoate dehydrogenase [Streptomyces sp. NPDC002088]|uniref:2,3-dihydro-2,3-dihydroxybenzoate dehydrogenase n=1 Tax=unclassified Streptomyces TaxID=2593676 RepID=UPI0033283ACC